jgi:hypothetical protein
MTTLPGTIGMTTVIVDPTSPSQGQAVSAAGAALVHTDSATASSIATAAGTDRAVYAIQLQTLIELQQQMLAELRSIVVALGGLPGGDSPLN